MGDPEVVKQEKKDDAAGMGGCPFSGMPVSGFVE